MVGGVVHGPCRSMADILRRLQAPAIVQHPYADHVAEFADYMVRERGLSTETVAYNRRTIHQFLAQSRKLVSGSRR